MILDAGRAAGRHRGRGPRDRRVGRWRASGNAPPELANDVIDQGLHLVGGGGMLPGLDQRIAHDTDVEVQLVENPLECVVLGAGHCIEEPGGPAGRLPGRALAPARPDLPDGCGECRRQ